MNNKYIAFSSRSRFSDEVVSYEPTDNSDLNILRSLKCNCDDEIVASLINHHCIQNIFDEEANTPLHFAVQRETVDIARLLIQKGAHVNARNEFGCTPLHLAVKYGRINVLQELLSLPNINKDEKNEKGQTPLYLSLLIERSDEVVSLLIDSGCNINLENGWTNATPLHLAVLRPTKTIACKLIERGADVNAQDSHDSLTPLHVAIKGCRDETLIAKLIDLVDNVNVPLYFAASIGSTFIARKLMAKGADVNHVNFEGDTLVHRAVHVGDLEYLCMLLYYGAPANDRDRYGRTPFFKSVCLNYHREEIVQSLINYTTDFDQVDKDNITVLYKALLCNYDIALDILEAGADVNKLSNGIHPLYVAWMGHISHEVLKMIWRKTDFDVFLTSKVRECDSGKSFMRIYCEHCKLQAEEFHEYLFMMLDSPYVEELVQPRCPESKEYLIYFLVSKRNLTPEQRLDVISVFLTYGVTVHFKDVCALYERYGFDECLEFLLITGCYIQPGIQDIFRVDPLIYKICYDDTAPSWADCFIFGIYLDSDREDLAERRDPYCGYYRATGRRRYNIVMFPYGEPGEIRSLQQISRDVIRSRIYGRSSTRYSFGAYHAMSKLPVPPAIRDILFLKRPIYANT